MQLGKRCSTYFPWNAFILCPDKLIKKAILPIDSQEMLTEKHNNEKLAITLLIVGVELIDYHFWKAFTSLA